jgi:hypothetical protein
MEAITSKLTTTLFYNICHGRFIETNLIDFDVLSLSQKECYFHFLRIQYI